MSLRSLKRKKMKRLFITLCLMGCASMALAQSPEVTIKRGKATMDEAYYYQLKQQAAEAKSLAEQNEALQQQLNNIKKEPITK